MKHERKTLEILGRTYTVIAESFDSTNELRRVCEGRELINSINRRNDFFGGQDGRPFVHFDKASELFERMDRGISDKSILSEVDRSVRNVRRTDNQNRICFQNSVAGFAPIVPLAIMNVPMCMRSMTRKPIKSKVVEVVWDSSVLCNVSSETLSKVGREMLKTVLSLEMQGYRVRLRVVSGFYQNGLMCICSTILKKESQPMDLARILFPTTDIAYERGCMFGWYVRCPEAKAEPGLGTSPRNALGKKGTEELYRQLYGDNAIPFIVGNYVYSNNLEEEVKDGIESALAKM